MPADILIVALLAAALYLAYKSETARARQIERRNRQRREQGPASDRGTAHDDSTLAHVPHDDRRPIGDDHA